MNDPDHHVETSLERSAKRLGIDNAELPKMEKGLVRYFTRQAQHFLTDVRADDDPIEWRALMQHHGAPTRLLDWTFSFPVALYFAIEKGKVEKSKTTCAVWCLDQHWLLEKVERKFEAT